MAVRFIAEAETDGETVKFRFRNEDELLQLTDEKHVEYIVSARNAGETEAMTAAIGTFGWRRQKMVMGLLALKNVPVDDREQVFMEVMFGTLKASFDGVSVGQVVNLIKTITKFKIADYFERNKKTFGNESLPGPDDDFGPERGETDDRFTDVEIDELIESVLKTRSPDHRRVIELRRDGFPSKEIAGMMDGSMSPANVDKIFSRFNKDLAEAFDE